MRKLLLFVVSVAMLVGGLYLLGAELLWAKKWYVWMVIAAAMLITLGAYLCCGSTSWRPRSVSRPRNRCRAVAGKKAFLHQICTTRSDQPQ